MRASIPSPTQVSVIVPAWNDDVRLARALKEYVPALEGAFSEFEVVVVSDGEKGPTRRVVSEYESRGVVLVEFPRRLGKGGAVVAGLRIARFPIAGFVDADAPVSAEDLTRLILALADNDAVIASRRLQGSNISSPRRISRRLLSRGWNLLVRSILGLPFHDTQCGAKFFRRNALETILESVTLKDWAFDVSLLFHLTRRGAKLSEFPVTWRSSDESKIELPLVIPFMALSIVGIRLMRTRLGRRIPSGWVSWFLEQASKF